MYPYSHEKHCEPETIFPQYSPGLRNRLHRCAGPLALSAVCLSASLVPNAETFSALSQLGVRNTETIMNYESRYNFGESTASNAIDQTLTAFHLRGGYYIDNIDSVSGFASTWHQYQLLNMLDVGRVLNKNPDIDFDLLLNQGLSAVNTYWQEGPTGYPSGYDATKDFGIGAADRFVDDNLWMSQILMRQYKQNGDEALLARAKEIMNLFVSQRDPKDRGVYWKVQFPTEPNHDKASVSNATAIPTLVELYLSGGKDPDFIKTAEHTFNWLQELRDPATGLYYDKFTSYGKIDKTIFSYVQGEILDSMLQLNRVDPIKFPLEDAVGFAETSMEYFSNKRIYGISEFDVIYIKALMRLAVRANNAELNKETQHAIALARNAVAVSPTNLADVASTATIISLSALPLADWRKL